MSGSYTATEPWLSMSTPEVPSAGLCHWLKLSRYDGPDRSIRCQSLRSEMIIVERNSEKFNASPRLPLPTLQSRGALLIRCVVPTVSATTGGTITKGLMWSVATRE